MISGAYKRQFEFDLEPEVAYKILVDQNFKCAISGVDIKFDTKGRDHTASLDRIDSVLGYNSTNVQWVHRTINRMKGALSDHEFIEWCKLVVFANDNS